MRNIIMTAQDAISLAPNEFFAEKTRFNPLPDGMVAHAGLVLVQGIDSDGVTSWWTRFFGDINHAELNWKLVAYVASELRDEMREWQA